MNARPLKNEEEKQKERIEVKCTTKEKEEIIALSNAHGFRQHSTFMRLASLGMIQIDRSRIESRKTKKKPE